MSKSNLRVRVSIFTRFCRFTLPVIAVLMMGAKVQAAYELIKHTNFSNQKAVSFVSNPERSSLNDRTWKAKQTDVYFKPVRTSFCSEYVCPGGVIKTLACFSKGSNWKMQLNRLRGLRAVSSLKADTRYRLTVVAVPHPDAYKGSASSPATLIVDIGDKSGNSYEFAELAVDKRSSMGAAISLNKKTVEFVTPKSKKKLSNGVIKLGVVNKGTVDADSLCISDISFQEVPKVAATKIAINSHGYLLGQKRMATVANLPRAASNYRWELRRYGKINSGRGYRGSTIRIQGDLIERNGVDRDSGDVVAHIDFSTKGSYPIYSSTEKAYQLSVIDKVKNDVVIKSEKFSITSGNLLYRDLTEDALYSFYHQHGGIVNPIKDNIYSQFSDYSDFFPASLKAFFGGLERSGHGRESASCFEGIDLHGNYWPGCSGLRMDVREGWYDAADHGKYVVNGAVTVWTLLNTYERLAMKSSTDDNALTQFIPNGFGAGRRGVEELISEARREMEFLMSMQIPDGTKMSVPVGMQSVTLGDDTQILVSERSVRGHPYDPALIDDVDKKGDPFGVYQKGLKDRRLDHDQDASGYFSDLLLEYNGGHLPRLKIKLDLSKTDVGGMAFHAIHDRCWTGIPTNPGSYSLSCNDRDGDGDVDNNDALPYAERRVLMHPTSSATLGLAAVTAQCYRVWSHYADYNPSRRRVSQRFADKCLAASKRAFAAASKKRDALEDVFRYEYTNHPWKDVDSSGNNEKTLQYGFALNPLFNGGGAYGDLRVGDEFYWAGSELYLALMKAGEESEAVEVFEKGHAQIVVSGTDDVHGQYSVCADKKMPINCYSWAVGWDWQNVATLGTLSLLTKDPSIESIGNVTGSPKDNLLTFANTLSGYVKKQGYGLPQNYQSDDVKYEWGANGAVLNRAIILAMAADITDNEAKGIEYKSAVIQSMDYLLGRNALSKSYISGYGANAMANAHHRFFAKHVDISYPAIPPGFIAGGPNSRDFEAIMANATHDKGRLTKGSDYAAYHFLNNTLSACARKNASGENIIPYELYGQRCYSDHSDSFATNEIAINWQAPLVWVSQYLSEQ